MYFLCACRKTSFVELVPDTFEMSDYDEEENTSEEVDLFLLLKVCILFYLPFVSTLLSVE